MCNINATEPGGKEVAISYAIYGFRTLLLTDAEGRVIHQWLGYSRERFEKTLEEALSDLTPLDEKRARYEVSPNAADAAALARYHGSRREPAEALRFYREARRLKPRGTDHYLSKNLDLAEADRLAERAVALTPAGKERVDQLVRFALECSSCGRHSKALSMLERAEREDPGNPLVVPLVRKMRQLVSSRCE